MRIVLLLFFFATNLFALAQSPIDALAKYKLFGREYVRITHWAKSNQIQLEWVVNEKLLRATNSSTRMLFEINSRKAQIGGINLTLSQMIILDKGIVYISPIDIEATLHPLLFPKKMPAGDVIKTICLDAGHGGKDPGKIDGQMEEKRFTLLLSEEVERLLKLAGFKVVQTRAKDIFVEWVDRPKTANQKNADLFVSLHFNAAASRIVQGSEVYCLTPEGAISSNGGQTATAYPGHDQNSKNILLAYQIQKSLVKNLGAEDHGIKRAQFEVLLSLKMPGVLIEGGYMTSPIESKRIYDSAYRKKMALAIVDGILAYQRIVERKPA